MSQDIPSPPSAFGWNSGWFGAQIGGTLWLLVGAWQLSSPAPSVAGIWVGCFALANVAGSLLWSRRRQIRAFTAYQLLLATLTIDFLIAASVLNHFGSGGQFSETEMRQMYWVPLLPLVAMPAFVIFEFQARRAKRGNS